MDQHPLSTPGRQLLAEELGGVCFDRCPVGGQGRADAPVRDELWILGQPPLDDYLHHVQHKAVEAIRPAIAADEWRKANDVYHELEQTEAGSADAIETGALPSAMADVLEEVRADPRYQVTFDTFPTTIEMVELDRLVLLPDSRHPAVCERAVRAVGPRSDAGGSAAILLPATGPSERWGRDPPGRPGTLSVLLQIERFSAPPADPPAARSGDRP